MAPWKRHQHHKRRRRPQERTERRNNDRIQYMSRLATRTPMATQIGSCLRQLPPI
eukprot:CAMPEP_0119506100 /NCGR_PEP_ID=MMETSP1344-20130328/26437_1 /TAXON_ID=236787 /ORGANISM="Florenciella parvula, Strain CCMP2471" /LENGTH=54 /DNA_ID=CAMNT_0007542611 /DNA_START=65 /DNA_END=226 /DNA_ORIENTATION=+